MIGRILDAVARRVDAADAAVKTDDTLTLTISAEGESQVAASRGSTSHLRVVRDGRIGCASAAGLDAAELAGRAVTAAASGEEYGLFLPASSPLPDVLTGSPEAASADAAALDGLARGLKERLERGHRRVEAWAERSSGSVRVANTRGLLAGYDVTLAGVGALIEPDGSGAPAFRIHAAQAALPAPPEVEELVAEVERRLGPPVIAWPGPRSVELPVCLTPRAAVTWLRPLRAALLGREAWLGRSPFRGKLGEQILSEHLSVTDDPLAPGRPGSRPVDDEGVPSRTITLIERGRLVSLTCDLRVGAAAGVPSTGHAWRLPAAIPRVGFTNFRVVPGPLARDALLGAMGKGLLVEDLDWAGGPNPLIGLVAFRTPWAYLVDGGEVRGRVEGVVLSGNTFDSLARIRGIGSDATWVGALCLPSLLVEGIRVTVTA
jgi:PmbA protein